VPHFETAPPGSFATALLTAFVCFWTFWSASEFYYEGWGTPFPQPLAYLIPFAIALALGAATLAWPRVMGGAIIRALKHRVLRLGHHDEPPALGVFVRTDPLLGRHRHPHAARRRALHRRRTRARKARGSGRSVRAPRGGGAASAGSASWACRWRSRSSSRRSSCRRFSCAWTTESGGPESSKVTGCGSVWAPAGPGWNWQQPWGGYPSWDSLALYGEPPVGLKTAGRRAPDMRRQTTWPARACVGTSTPKVPPSCPSPLASGACRRPTSSSGR